MGWLRNRLGAAVALVGRALVEVGAMLRTEPGLDETYDVDEPVPQQQPITDETRAVMNRKPRWRSGETTPAEEPPLQGSARERYLRHPRRSSRRHRR